MEKKPYPSLAHRWFQEVWNEGREQTIDEIYAVSGSAHGLEHSEHVSFGPPEFKQFWHALREAFADIRFTVHDVVTAPDPSGAGTMQAARWGGTMRHVAGFHGVAATGRVVTVTGMSFTLLSDGQIIKAWNNWDLYGVLQQLQQPQP